MRLPEEPRSAEAYSPKHTFLCTLINLGLGGWKVGWVVVRRRRFGDCLWRLVLGRLWNKKMFVCLYSLYVRAYVYICVYVFSLDVMCASVVLFHHFDI